jgi:hypothetical protein
MYIIKLNQKKGDMYKEVYDFEGFRTTNSLEEATKFRSTEEAEKILQSPAVSKMYQQAEIERITLKDLM